MADPFPMSNPPDDAELDRERFDTDDDAAAMTTVPVHAPADEPDDQSGHISDSPDPLDHMAENFGLDAAPGTKGVKASGAGLSGDVAGNATGANDPDTYRDAPRSGAKTGGGGL